MFTSPRRSLPAFTPLGAHDPARLGPHRLLGRLGSGGMGTVYLGRSRFGRLVAVKAVHPELADEPEFRARFAREVGSLRRVRSRFVPRFIGAAPRAPSPWLATEFIPGPTLHARVRSTGPLIGRSLTRLAAGVASALADIHGAGLVHRDLKPSNVIISPDGPRILDFGIARALDSAPYPPTGHAYAPGRDGRSVDVAANTRAGGVAGTPGWIAPERLLGAPATTASDVFSWGQLTAYAATGRNPFGRGSVGTVTRRVLRGAADLAGLPSELFPPVHAALTAPAAYRPTPEQILRDLQLIPATPWPLPDNRKPAFT
ncbi:serine/threonine-protein kinase [Nocardiopsis metallicus]|uniref:Serine/threonine protein kinase n=1 Tax=Nocardiopsis metallicus TaxID=179819 RepID=A0A840WJL8_9ACTN|nr:serine/threonine-protein kinase [Nocardiopsis metallicus]MBB5491877.1 serine/threonine protein kinase [Nocardiopsis metallicus]